MNNQALPWVNEIRYLGWYLHRPIKETECSACGPCETFISPLTKFYIR